MEPNLLIRLGGGLVNLGLVLALAPLCEGLLRKLTARIQSRQGPPLWQPYYDLLKLLGKEDIESGELPILQRAAAVLSLTSVLSLAFLMPMGLAAAGNGLVDVLLIIYVLTLSGICTLLAGLASGSPYSLLGINREMMSMITLEPLLAIAIMIGVLHADSFRLDSVLAGSVYRAAGIPWSGLIMLGVILLSFQAFVQRIPFDISEAETEIMEGPLVEYSGPKLALFKYAQMSRLVVYSGLMVSLFLPWGGSWGFPLGWLCFWLKVMAVVVAVTFVAATHARYRIDQAIRFYVSLLGVAFGALMMAAYGW